MERVGERRQTTNRGRPPYSTGRFVYRRRTNATIQSNDASLFGESGSPKSGSQKSVSTSIDDVTKQLNNMTSDYQHGSNFAPNSAGRASPSVDPRSINNLPKPEGPTPEKIESPSVMVLSHDKFPSLSTRSESKSRDVESIRSINKKEQSRSSSQFSCTLVDNTPYTKEKPFPTVHSGSRDCQFSGEVKSGESASQGSRDKVENENSNDQHKLYSFDICLKRVVNVVKLKSPLFVANREKRNEAKRQDRGENIILLRPGMVLLKSYLSLKDQVKLIKSCRNLGMGSGGFYQPGYSDGAKLHLKMMCLGKNWDPETSMYVDRRPIDGSIPPPMPKEFHQMVMRVIHECHAYLESHLNVKNPKDILPSFSPDICIVNFYTSTGNLGLHQDKDESRESLRRGLPVVSFSLGDSAEFLYGDERDILKVEKVVLESGDVLIFGGKSRHIFHGVSSIIPNTTPKPLTEETDLRPGRLNLTFREY